MIHIKDDEGRTIGYADRVEYQTDSEYRQFGAIFTMRPPYERYLEVHGFKPHQPQFDPKGDTIEDLEEQIADLVNAQGGLAEELETTKLSLLSEKSFVKSLDIEIASLISRLEAELEHDTPVSAKDAKRAVLLSLKEIKELI